MPRQGRGADELRRIELVTGFTDHAEGSVLCTFGGTRVLCNATAEERVPSHVKGSGRGWVTAEYGMLPRSTHTRTDREAAKGKQTGRTQEIQRLIGRSLRAACDLAVLGERQVLIDCDVIQADGGTRTAAITGGWVALALAVRRLHAAGKLPNKATKDPIRMAVAAISAGIVEGEPRLDLPYVEDSAAEVDCNFVMTDTGRFVEIQGTAERDSFSAEDYASLVALASAGTKTLFALQREALTRARP